MVTGGERPDHAGTEATGSREDREEAVGQAHGLPLSSNITEAGKPRHRSSGKFLF